jgi:hypothetical protein
MRGVNWCGVALLSVGALGLGAAGCAAESNEPAEETLGTVEHGVVCTTILRPLGSVADTSLVVDPVDPTRASTNYGGGVSFSLGAVGSGQRSGLVRFDLASKVPIGSTVHSATLSLRKALGVGPTMLSLHDVTTPWSEAAVTYSSFGGGVLCGRADDLRSRVGRLWHQRHNRRHGRHPGLGQRGRKQWPLPRPLRRRPRHPRRERGGHSKLAPPTDDLLRGPRTDLRRRRPERRRDRHRLRRSLWCLPDLLGRPPEWPGVRRRLRRSHLRRLLHLQRRRAEWPGDGPRLRRTAVRPVRHLLRRPAEWPGDGPRLRRSQLRSVLRAPGGDLQRRRRRL